MPSTLIYRATRDGFKFDDWQRCCLGKGPTMTLIKVRRLLGHNSVRASLCVACGLPLFAD